MTAILAILGTIGSAIGAILKMIPPTAWLILMAMVVGMLLVSRGCGPGGWGCRRTPRPPRTWTFTVVSVESGNRFTVKAGLLKRKTATVILSGIAVPEDGTLADESRLNLERLAGQTVSVSTVRGRLLAAEDAERDVLELEARGEMCGRVIGASGSDCALEQLRAGMAKVSGVLLGDDAKEFADAEREAKTKKIGVWAKKKA